jgi:uncharacterized protein (DUF362 family)
MGTIAKEMNSYSKNRHSKSSLVSIVRSSYSDVSDNLSKAIELAGGIELSDQDKIIIKVNLCDARTPDTGTITHPVFLDALLKYLRERFPTMPIFVVESDGRVVISDLFVKWFGLLPIIKKWGAEWRNLSKEDCETKHIPKSRFNELPCPKIFENAYFITLAKLKTNILTTITCCLKNQRGCNPMLNKQQFHSHIDEAIIAENLAVGVPDFSIVDGIVGVGGIWGPSFGIPINSQLIISGKDEVAVDVVCAKIMGFNPKRIGHIKLAAKRGLGSTSYKTVGETIESVRQDFQWSSFQAMLFKLAQRIKNNQFRRSRHEE